MQPLPSCAKVDIEIFKTKDCCWRHKYIPWILGWLLLLWRLLVNWMVMVDGKLECISAKARERLYVYTVPWQIATVCHRSRPHSGSEWCHATAALKEHHGCIGSRNKGYALLQVPKITHWIGTNKHRHLAFVIDNDMMYRVNSFGLKFLELQVGNSVYTIHHTMMKCKTKVAFQSHFLAHTDLGMARGELLHK